MKQTITPEQYLRAEARLDGWGFQLALHLADGLEQLPHDISERLRVARVQAVAHRKLPVRQLSPALASAGNTASLNVGEDEGGLWRRMLQALPLLALAAGLLAIDVVQNDNRVTELAEVDAALLTDDLPPAAYADPGFAQFLKWSREHGR